MNNPYMGKFRVSQEYKGSIDIIPCKFANEETDIPIPESPE